MVIGNYNDVINYKTIMEWIQYPPQFTTRVFKKNVVDRRKDITPETGITTGLELTTEKST